MSGSLLGPLLFFILFNAVRLLTRYYGVAYGYRKGIDIVKDMGGGFLQKLTEGHPSSACLSWGVGEQVDAREHPAGGINHHRSGWSDSRHHRADYPRPADAGPGTAAVDLRLYVAAA